MKHAPLPILVLAVSLHLSATAEQVVLGTNLVTIAFEDQTLSVEDRLFIADEWLRVMAPAVGRALPAVGAPGTSDYEVWDGKAAMPPLPSMSRTPTNLVVAFSSSDSAAWASAKAFCESVGTAVAELDAFVTNRLARSSIEQATDGELARLILTKEWEPGSPPTLAPGQTGIRNEWFPGEFFLPPRFTLSFFDAGPSATTSNLWASIPVMRGGRASEMPAAYYDGQWYLSQWFSEAGSKQW